MVQKRVARFATDNCIYETGTMNGILEQLKWESLKQRRRDSRFIILYKGLKGAASIPTNDLAPPPSQLGMSESITLWHFKPLLLILTFTRAFSSPRLVDIGIHLHILSFLLLKVEMTVAKFTFLVRASQITGPGEWLLFGRIPSDNSDSDLMLSYATASHIIVKS